VSEKSPVVDRPDLVLLGPQRRRRTVADAVSDLGLDSGPVAVVTAGWQEREGEDAELCAAIGRPARNLRLYARAEGVMSSDPELAAAWRKTQVRLRQLQELYRVRLEHAVHAAREVWNRRRRLDAGLVEEQLASAVEAVRSLDAEHLDRLRRVRAEAEASWRLEQRPAVVQARAEVAREASECRAVVVAGGHVVVLLNRLRLLGVEPLLRSRPVVAWSAGAMVLGRRVVIFHDSPPQGPGAAEVVETGFGVMHGVVPFPHATRRLRLSDAERVAGLARRMSPATCVALDEGTRLDRSPDGAWIPISGVRRLGEDGRVESWESA
jgi:peptidase E